MQNVLVFKHVSKKLGKRKVINNVTFQVKKGSITGFIGPNGAGKTTAIKLMTGLINNTEGEIFLNEVSITDKKNALKEVGAIVEEPIFFPYMSGKDNLKVLSFLIEDMTKEEKKKKINEVLSIVNLTERENDDFKTYSLGMKQRLGIAQALLNNPKLVILDEPTNGLDPLGVREFRELILRLNKEKGITFFISSHLLGELQLICTDFIIINEGNIMWAGTKENLLTLKGKEGLEEAFVAVLRGEIGEDTNKHGVL
ncbi:ABC transporter ATP-binding protein [Hathewaya histolytica]|uniref:ABC transporter ATP-binding protein n=1 Tax=Hathewaya histolytica TaxID=1498 RepID=UPI003B67B24C